MSNFGDGSELTFLNRYELTQEENLSPFNVPLSQISGYFLSKCEQSHSVTSAS